MIVVLRAADRARARSSRQQSSHRSGNLLTLPRPLPRIPDSTTSSSSKTKSKNQADVQALVSFQLQITMTIRIFTEICAINLRHDTQRAPPLLLPVTDHRPEEDGCVLPMPIFRQLVMVTQFQAD